MRNLARLLLFPTYNDFRFQNQQQPEDNPYSQPNFSPNLLAFTPALAAAKKYPWHQPNSSMQNCRIYFKISNTFWISLPSESGKEQPSFRHLAENEKPSPFDYHIEYPPEMLSSWWRSIFYAVMMIASCIVVVGTDTTLLFRKRSAVLTENDQNSHLPTRRSFYVPENKL